jgi:UDP-N-acetylglucosamine acyltransferase
MIHEKALIHPTAIIEEGAHIEQYVEIGAYSFIGSKVSIGRGTKISSHVVIRGRVKMGEENEIFSFASLDKSQDLKYKNEDTSIEIGNKNILREFVTVQLGTIQDQGVTRIGDSNLFMNYVHVAHDCVIGNSNIFSNQAQLAGHVTIGNMAVIGGFSGFHQHVRVGDMAMSAAGALVSKDVPPYCIAAGAERAVLKSLNSIALRRRGVDAQTREALKQAYKILFLKKHPTIESALEELRATSLLEHKEVSYLVEFVKTSKRGVVRPVRSLDNREGSNHDDV